MRVAVVQTDPAFGDVRRNVAEAVRLIESVDAELYVLPELFNTGYNFASAGEVQSLAEGADGPTFRSLAAVAEKKQCSIAYGFAERSQQGGQLYNSAALVGPDGVVGLYRKVHLFYRENLFFAPGDLGFPVFRLPWGVVGMMICFDWYFPESARSLVIAGAEIIAHPSNLVLPHCPEAMKTRCLENKVYAATADRVGVESRGGESFQFIGSSQVVSPQGEVLVRMGREEAGVRVVEIDLDKARDKRLNSFNRGLTDRRPEQYRTGS